MKKDKSVGIAIDIHALNLCILPLKRTLTFILSMMIILDVIQYLTGNPESRGGILREHSRSISQSFFHSGSTHQQV